MLCLCATVALLFVFATANVASAQEAAGPETGAAVACPCEFAPAAVPCRWGCAYPQCVKACPPVVSYRVGLFGHIRPVVQAPVYRPVPVRFAAPVCAPPVYVAPRFVAAPCPAYVVPARPVFCW